MSMPRAVGIGVSETTRRGSNRLVASLGNFQVTLVHNEPGLLNQLARFLPHVKAAIKL